MQIVTPIGARYLSQGKKNIFFPIGDFPGTTVQYVFGKLSSRQCYAHFTCNSAVSRYSQSKFRTLEQLGVLPKGRKPIPARDPYHSTITQNFTPIGCTSAELFDPHTQNHLKLTTGTSVAFAG